MTKAAINRIEPLALLIGEGTTLEKDRDQDRATWRRRSAIGFPTMLEIEATVVVGLMLAFLVATLRLL
jgi:hypothetical protein